METRGRVFNLCEQTGLENVELYQAGGLYPGSIKTTLGSSGLRLENKLGAGGFGTVWLAQRPEADPRLPNSPPRELVAVKILTGQASHPEPNESRILHRLKQAGPAGKDEKRKRQSSLIAELRDEFTVASSNGEHRCLVLDAYGPSVKSWLTRLSMYRTSMQPEQARKAALQTAEAVAWLHEAGVVHGDLHTGNILLNIEGFKTWPLNRLHEMFGDPFLMPLKRFDEQPLRDEAPSEVVLSMPLDLVDPKYIHGDITLIDFGEAFMLNDPPQVLGTPAAYAAPEVLLKTGQYSAAVDIWSLGCCIYELRTGLKLFWPFFNPREEVVQQQVALFGPLPRSMWEDWEGKARCFEEDGTLKQSTAGQGVKSLEQTLQQAAKREHLKLDKTELEQLLDLLTSMFCYDPEKRPSAAEVVKHPWFFKREITV